MSREKLLKFLNDQSDLFSYEQTAMSEARFARFLDELLDVLEEKKA